MKTRMKMTVIVILVFAVIAVLFISLLHQNKKLPKSVSIDTSQQPTLGNPNASIHFVIFEDLKCHNCMRYNVEIFPKIEEKYIQTGKAKYTVINVAFLQGSLPAANAAHCVYSQNKKWFFLYIKAIFNNQPPEEENWATIPNLVKFADNIPGINQKKLSQCIYKSPYTSFINNNLQMGMKLMNGVVATPTLYINGYIVKPLTIKRIHQIIKAVK